MPQDSVWLDGESPASGDFHIMPPTLLNLELFEPRILVSTTAIQSALRNINAVLDCADLPSDATKYILSKLLASEYVHAWSVELALSGNYLIRSHTLDSFPTSLKEYSSSLFVNILSRLALFFLGVECPKFDANLEYRSFTGTHRILLALSTIDLDSFDRLEESMLDAESLGTIEPVIAPIHKQRQRKQKRRHLASCLTLDEKMFVDFNESIPSSKVQAVQDIDRFLRYQKRSLEVYLQNIVAPEVTTMLHTFILSSCRKQEKSEVKVTDKGRPELVIDTTPSPLTQPSTRPIKAAIDFDGIDDFGEWDILISTTGTKNLTEAKRSDVRRFKIYMKKIQELSKGQFSDDNQKRLTHTTGSSVPIYEAKMTRDSRLVYQVHCVAVDDKVERQAIRIFGIYTHAQLERLALGSLAMQLGKHGKEYRRRCNFRNQPVNPGDHVYRPACFPATEDEAQDTVDYTPQLPKEDWDQIHTFLVTEKFIPFSKSLIRNIIAELDSTHPFAMTPQEREIIDHIRSCYVIGRSGTGKTTTILFKIFGIERAYELHSGSCVKPRQIFVTKSQVLAAKVEEVYDKLKQTLLADQKTKDELLVMAREKRGKEQDNHLVAEEDQEYRVDLPQRFSLLGDNHFPLFITFDRLCKLLENDIDHFLALQSPVSYSALSAHVYDDNQNADVFRFGFSGSFIDFLVFKRDYWPHFSQNLIKGLSPTLVFNEIIGVIKGSEEACCHEARFMDRTTYENLSHRSHWTFATHRATVYTIFEQYLKKKREAGDYDAADRTHYILQRLGQDIFPRQYVDYLYVDEAQDNLIIDALLLRFLCRNADGLFWAGDTAQTISMGSSFRFSDLKAFLYRNEGKQSHAQQGEPPKTFQLTTNYRSHAGIVSCAYSVIQIICRFWGDSIDLLAPEKGVVDGDKPVFFSGWNDKNARYEQFLFTANSGNYMEFGARQCILVRHEAAREALRAQVGSGIGLILTLYESKGLEFDDVLIHNFFEDSTIELAQWRVVLNVLDHEDAHISVPRFDDILHAGICNELKFLYVAITRARKNAWIIDRSDKGEPMRHVWTAWNQIQNCTPTTDVPRLAVSSTPEEWLEQGKNLFRNNLWLQAMHCFDRADRPRDATVCKAYHLRAEAKAIPVSRSIQMVDKRRKAFRATAEIFLKCANDHGNTNPESKAYFKAAGETFKDAGDFVRGAEAYKMAEEYNDAAQLYRKADEFDEAVAVVVKHRDKMAIQMVENILNVAKLFYFRSRDIVTLKKATILFDNVDKALEYLEEIGLDSQRSALLEHIGRNADAAEIHASNGRTRKAVELYLSRPELPDAVKKGQECILEGLRDRFILGLQGAELKADQTVNKFLDLARGCGMSMLHPSEQDEVQVFQAIYDHDLATLKLLGMKFLQHYKMNYMVILSLDHYFSRFPHLDSLPIEGVADVLSLFSEYAKLLTELASRPKPWLEPKAKRLFAIQWMEEGDSYFLPSGCFLEKPLNSYNIPFIPEESGARLTPDALQFLFSRVIKTHLQRQIEVENTKCLEAQAFSLPCLYFIANGSCHAQLCRRRHLGPKAVSSDLYTAQVRLHLQQVMIIHCDTKQKRHINQRIWMERLYNSLFPVYYTLGSLSQLQSALISEGKQAFQIIKYWAQDLLRTPLQTVEHGISFLPHLMRIAMISFVFDLQDASTYVYTSPALISYQAFPQFVHNGSSSTIVVALCRALQAAPNNKGSINVGIDFVKTITQRRFHADISVLCDFIEYLAGQLLLNRPVLNGLTMPKSWLFFILKHSLNIRSKSTSGWRHFLEAISQILNDIRTGRGEYLWFEGKNLSGDDRKSIRTVFLARLIRTMGLLGSNFNIQGPIQDKTRSIITRDFQALKSGEPPKLYRSYASGEWKEILRAVQRSTSDSPLDELVELSCQIQFRLTPAPIRRLKFRYVSDIPKLLLRDQSSFVGLTTNIRNTNLRAIAPTFVPGSLRQTSILPRTPASQEPEPQGGENDIADDSRFAAEVEDITAPSLADKIEETPQPSQEVLRAVAIIHRYRQQKEKALKRKHTPHDLKLSKHYENCLEKLDASKPRRFKLLFLGCIPHLLLVIQLLDEYAQKRKGENKKRMQQNTGEELDECQRQITLINPLVKGLSTLKKQFDPSSSFYGSHDDFSDRLKSEMLTLEESILNTWPLTQKLKDALLDDLMICVWSVDRKRIWDLVDERQREEAKLPELHVEDLDPAEIV